MNNPVESQPQTHELLMSIVDEFSQRLNRGESPSIESYVEREPELADMIRKVLAAVQTMQAMEPGELLEDRDGKAFEPHLLGDFRILRLLGRGGMGAVYEAEQMSLRRRVALKVFPYAAMLDERALQRFRNEVTAAAQLDHPNIIPVHGVGTDRGVHHYAMRLIDGVTLAEIIDQLRYIREHHQAFPDSIAEVSSKASGNPARLSSSAKETETRSAQETRASTPRTPWKNIRQPHSHFRSVAQLGATIAKALDHAHHHGIVHRDVKPSNIMIDGSGKPWVADFGLAQVETGTGITMTGDILGTAQYMSPEQSLGNRVILDHRTDIYSLGVTLYELLTLRLPFDGENRRELLRRIAIEEPKKLRQINPAIPTDLATIIMKAVEKCPDDRYETAMSFAEDLQRFTENQSIIARRPHVLKRISKWVVRHSTFSWAVAIVFIMAAIISATSAIIVTKAYQDEQSARKNAEELNQSNLALSKEAKAAIDQYVETVQRDAMLQDPIAASLRNELLLQARGYYQKLIAHLRRSDSKLELAETMLQVAQLTSDTGSANESVATVRQAIEVLTELFESRSDSDQIANGLSRAYDQLFGRLVEMGKEEESMEAFEKAVVYGKLACLLSPGNKEHMRLLALLIRNGGVGKIFAGKNDEALKLFLESKAISAQLYAEDPKDKIMRIQLANILLDCGHANLRLSNKNSAVILFEQAAQLADDIVSSEPDDIDALQVAARAYQNTAAAHNSIEQLPKKRVALEKAQEYLQKLVLTDPHRWTHRNWLATNLTSQASLAQMDREPDLAQLKYEQAIAQLEILVERNPEVKTNRVRLAEAQTGLGRVLGNQQQDEHAVSRLTEAVRLAQDALNAVPLNSDYELALYEARHELTEAYLDLGNAAAARNELGLTKHWASVRLEADPGNTDYHFYLAETDSRLASMELHNQNLKSALELLYKALSHMKVGWKRNNPRREISLCDITVGLVHTLVQLNRIEDAHRELVAQENQFPTALTYSVLASQYMRLSDHVGSLPDTDDRKQRRQEFKALSAEAAKKCFNLVLERSRIEKLFVVKFLCHHQHPPAVAAQAREIIWDIFPDNTSDSVVLLALSLASLRAGLPNDCLDKLDSRSSKAGSSDLNDLVLRTLAHSLLNQHEQADQFLTQAENEVHRLGYCNPYLQKLLNEARTSSNR